MCTIFPKFKDIKIFQQYFTLNIYFSKNLFPHQRIQKFLFKNGTLRVLKHVCASFPNSVPSHVCASCKAANTSSRLRTICFPCCTIAPYYCLIFLLDLKISARLYLCFDIFPPAFLFITVLYRLQ